MGTAVLRTTQPSSRNDSMYSILIVDDCGGVIDLQRETENIISPGYRYYREYDIDMTCTWLVNVSGFGKLPMI